MTGRRTLTIAAATALAIGAIPLGIGAASASNSGSADERASISAKPKKGRYQGKVGTFARIIFKTDRKKRIKRLDAGVQASCQRASDQAITRITLLAIRSTKKIKVNKRNGKFKSKGTDRENDVAWEIKGRFVSRKKAKGYFKASQFVPLFNPFLGTIDSELCAGSGKWTARLK